VGVNDEQEQEPRGGGGRPQRERRGCSIAPLGRSHQGGGEGVVVNSMMIFLVLRFQSPEVQGRRFVLTTVTESPPYIDSSRQQPFPW